MLDVRGVLGYERELALLTGGPWLGHLGHDKREGFAVYERRKLTAFQQEPEVADSQPQAEELSVERTVFTLPGG